MSIAQDLATRIRNYALEAPERNRLLQATLSGDVTPAGFAVYLANIRYLLSQTVPTLERACKRSRELGRTELEAFFAHKISEETGHVVWAVEDQDQLRERFAVPTDFAPLATMHAIVQYVQQTVDLNPARYLGYILFAEYYTVLAAPAWLDALESCCGIPRSMVSAIGNHVELDQHHVAEGLAEMDQLVNSQEASELVDTVVTTMEMWDAFFAEVAEECARQKAA
jgi:hypothetical protein